MNESFLSDMRDALKSMMEAEPYYSDIPIINERLQNIDARVEQLVGKVGGLCIVLVTPSIGGALKNVKGANFSRILFVARVYENVKTNPVGKEALNVAIFTAAFWSQLLPDSLSCALILEDDAVNLGTDPRYLTYDVGATTEGGTQIEIPKLSDLSIDSSSLAAVAIAQIVATPGAAIFYTLDGSAPIPRNPAATLYLATFNAAPGSTLRARAWLPGYRSSAEKKIIL